LSESATTIRIDKWFFYARFFKTRAIAAKLVSGGHVRVNAKKIFKPAHNVGAGDTLTFPQGRRIRVVRLIAIGQRRGPAREALALFDDLTPAQEIIPPPVKTAGKGRPTKKDRRDMRLSGDGPLE